VKRRALVIGAGHNGLVAAFYLARAGLDVTLLERRAVVGGCAVTEEFWPGFRNSTASYTVSLLQPKVIADMQLARFGYRAVERAVANVLPLGDGRALTVGGGLARTQAEFARFSTADAARLPAWLAMLEGAADVLRALALEIPPEAGGGVPAMARLARQAWPLGRLPLERQRDLLALLTRPAAELLEDWFESDPVKAAFGFDSVVGNHASPETPGSAYVLLHHVFGELNSRRGAWGHAMGGMGAITGAMAAACVEAGARIRLEAPVAQVLADGGRVAGVRLAGGEELAADLVLANVGPKLLYGRLMDPADLPADFRRRMRGFRTGSGSFRMNVALAGLPRLPGLPDDQAEALTAGIILAPSLGYMHRAFTDSQSHGWSREPVVELLIPSTVDDSLAPPGAHVASLFCQQFAPHLPDGQPWADAEEAAADTVFATVERFIPGFRRLVLGRQILSPAGLEERFGLVDGDIFHGRMSLDQLWSARPILGFGAYRAPIAGLYLCGAGAHPGGGVTGAPGHNAARAVLADLRRSAGLRGLRRRPSGRG
jgi:phytoene dehydrogenase-like protein